MGQEAETIVKVLSEIREYDLAVELAIASKSSVAYPVMMMMREFKKNGNASEGEEEESVIVEDWAQSNDETRWNIR